uniref:Uncharacterized protein n=1 Tax=Arundo donax TaxID=35708 RepID=A0A0A9EQK6_ARUDO
MKLLEQKLFVCLDFSTVEGIFTIICSMNCINGTRKCN